MAGEETYDDRFDRIGSEMDNDCSSRGRRRSKEHIAIDVSQPDDNLITSIRTKMESISSLHCICRVKESLRSANKRSYVPDKISIGPYHHGNKDLRSMEDQKWRYVYALLSRKPNLESSLDACVVALKELEHRARSCYSDINFTTNDFLQMMLVDGCFIIELLLKYSMKSLRNRNDPIFNIPGMLFELRGDLILLENQIPLFVLQRLFQLVPIPKQCTRTLSELAYRFFRNMIPGDPHVHAEKFNREGNHLLDLICHCLLPTYPREQAKQSRQLKHLHAAMDLRAAGVRIRKARTNSLLDIKFSGGVLEIPQILVHQYTENLLRNLIALEQCSSESVHYITSYAILLKSLICSDRDVKLLKQKDILVNYDAKDDEIGKLFDKLCEEVDLKKSYYNGLCEQVSGYKGKSWRGLSKRVKRSYHKNPMLRFVFIVAILVLFLTLVGTLFSVLAFFLHRF